MKHKHAELMMQYAEDATKTDAPWEYWQFQSMNGGSWFSCDEEDMAWNIFNYRRKQKEYRMSKEDWQRVVDEKFYVEFDGNKGSMLHMGNRAIDDKLTDRYEVVREKGLRQPHFKGHPHPEGDERLWVGSSLNGAAFFSKARDVPNWEIVKEYVCL